MFEKRIWNRNCAWSPEELAVLTVKTNEMVNTAISRFGDVANGLNLNPTQRNEALKVFVAVVSDGLAESLANLQKACGVRTDF
jgi:hypothetical protein